MEPKFGFGVKTQSLGCSGLKLWHYVVMAIFNRDLFMLGLEFRTEH